MTIEELKNRIINKGGKYFTLQRPMIELKDENIEFSRSIINDSDFNKYLTLLMFVNCEFNGHELLFEEINKRGLSIYFRDCTINCNLYFKGVSTFKALKFIDVKNISNVIDIIGCEFNEFYFLNSDERNTPLLNGNIYISGNKFIEKVDFKNLNHSSGDFTFDGNILKTKEKSITSILNASFRNARLNNADFSKTDFGDEISFDKMELSYDRNINNFNDCIFNKAYFNYTNFGMNAFFNGSVFRNKTLFIACKNLENTLADFSNCRFEKNVHFNLSSFDRFIIKFSLFLGSSSFNNTTFKEIKIENTVFEGPAFFDDIKIINIKELIVKH